MRTKIQSRIEAGSQLLFLGSNDTFSETLKSRGIIHGGDQGNLCYFPEDDREFCCLWIPERPHDVKQIKQTNMKKILLEIILQKNIAHNHDQPMIVCFGADSSAILDEDWLHNMLIQQRNYRIEIIIADYATFMGMSENMRKFYMENYIFDNPMA